MLSGDTRNILMVDYKLSFHDENNMQMNADDKIRSLIKSVIVIYTCFHNRDQPRPLKSITRRQNYSSIFDWWVNSVEL